MVDINVLSPALLHHIDAVLDDGKVLQTQEVHLDESYILDDMTIVLGHQHILPTVLIVDDADWSNISYVL